MRWWLRQPAIPLGTTSFWHIGRWPLSITPDEACSHMHILGKTGSGKSYFLAGGGRMSGAVDPSGVLEGEVIPAGESRQNGWAPTRVERRVLLDGRIRQLQTEVRAQLAVHAVQTAAAVRQECRKTMQKALQEDLADHKTITDPLEKGFMERYDNDDNDQLRDFSLGVQRVAMYAAESVIRQPFDVEEPEQPLTFWELLLGKVSLERP